MALRLLLIDGGAFGLDLAFRCQQAGWTVKWYVTPNPKTDAIGKGLIERIDDWRKWIYWADLVLLTDNVKFLEHLEPYRKQGAHIIGPSVKSAQLELDRAVAMKVFQDHGIDVPPFKKFTNYEDGMNYVRKEMRGFASKPIGDCSDKNMSHVAKDPASLIYMMERWRRAGKRMDYILQTLVEGVEMAVGGWLGPHGFSEGWTENFEFKRFMAGEVGPQTGEMGTVLRVVKKSKLADKVLKPLEDYLVSLGHTGFCDVNCIIDEDGTPWPLEFTMRPGWPTANIQQVLIDGDPGQWLADLGDGLDSKPWKMDLTAAGVLLAIPDFPLSHLSRKEVCGVPVYGLTPEIMQWVGLCEMMMGSAPQEIDGKIVTSPCLVTAGDYVLVASGTGGTVRQATTMAYRILKTLKVPNSPMYRTDIGARLKKQLPMIQQHSYATGLEY